MTAHPPALDDRATKTKGGTAMVFGPGRRVARRTARRTVRRQEMLRGDGGYDEQAAPPPAAAPAAPDYTDELAELGQLHEQGVLTDEEFEAKKKQILGI
jgi:hypothetical protein